MSLALLAPLALATGVVLLGPVLAHLVRRAPTERVPYGAMLLLERLRIRLERRRRLHDRLILLLRLLGLLGLVLAAARPELRLPETRTTIGGSGRVVIVLDTSLSMDQRVEGEPAFARAQREAVSVSRGLGEGVQLAAITAGAPAETLAGFTTDHALVATLLEATRQGSGGTDLDGALALARGLLQGQPGEVVVIGDGSGPGRLATATHGIERLVATGSALLPRTFAPALAANLVVTEARYGDGLEGGTVSVTVRNFGPAGEVPATVRLPDGAQMTVFVEAPGATGEGPAEVSVSVTVPRQAEGGVASVSLADPALPLDDTRYFHLPRVGKSRVLVVDGDPGSTPTKSEVYFLERALAPFAGNGAGIDVVAPGGVSRLVEGKWQVAVLANVGDPSPIAPVLVDFVRGGGALVLAVGDNVSAEVWNPVLGGLLPSRLGRVRDLVALDAGEGVPLALPGADLELFEPFVGAGREGFGRVRSRRVYSLEPYVESSDVRTLLRYDTGVPALVEHRIGRGRVYLWTSSADLGWTNFPLQAIYAPTWQRLVSWLGAELGSSGARVSGTVGEPVEVSVPIGVEVDVTGPDGGRVEVTRAAGVVRFLPSVPGAYVVGRDGEPRLADVAVNTPLAESDVRPDEPLAEVTARIDPDRARRKLALDLAACLFAATALVAAQGLAARQPAEEAA
ncbi:MAG: VWA domain-containing protein [Deltaproteobacteria bacterium]|nr:VWA domain-containing protein [Deltaproteobacteria bacterium]